MEAAETETNPLPEGDYAIVELFGHTTLIGRIAEVERFGAKMLQIECVFDTGLLPARLHGGSAIYALTPCSRDIAWKHRPKHAFEIPSSLRAILPQFALEAPTGDAETIVEAIEEEDETDDEFNDRVHTPECVEAFGEAGRCTCA